MSKPVIVERHGSHILVVRFARAEARNAINPEMAQLIADAVESTRDDPDLRAGILTAEGDVFCAGADLKTVASGNVAQLVRGEAGFAGFIQANSPIPWIAAVGGLALGGGTEFALACDMVVASENAAFGLPEVRRGIIAAAGGILRLPRAIPRSIALEMICTGHPIHARRAYELGLVNHLTPIGGAFVRALELAEEIAQNAPIAVRESLAVARAAANLDEAELWRQSRSARRVISESKDFLEGTRAFVEKRPPVWQNR